MSNYKSYYLKSMGLSEDSLSGGKGDNLQTSEVDQEQLKMGIKVEMEHTKDPDLAKEIAMDHLAEDPQYYTNLKNAGMADELPGNQSKSQAPQMSKLLSPTAICPQVLGYTVRGTKSGDLPAHGHVADPEKAAMGGWEKVKVLPQGGVVGDPEKARFGGWDRVKNIKPNSQGTYSDTPASPDIKKAGGHFTPDTPEITKKNAPVTNVQGSDAIHPHQVQQLGNPPVEDDGTSRDGETTPESAGGGGPGAAVETPKAKRSQTDFPDPAKGPWGIELTHSGPEGEDDADVSIEIKETRDEARAEVSKKPWEKPAVKDTEKEAPKKVQENENMVQRFQQLANIKSECADCGCGKPNTNHMAEAGALSELRTLVDKMKATGKTSPAMLKAERYLSELGH